MNSPIPPPSAPGAASYWQRLIGAPRWVRFSLLGLAALLIWYGLVGALQAGISADPALRPTSDQLPPGGSVTVGFAARLVESQVDERPFTPNDPLFFPTAFARRTPAFQQQVIETTSVVVSALVPDQPEAPLTRAATHLQTPASQWWLNAGWPPIRISAERAYRRAIADLVAHNRALANERAAGVPQAERVDPAAFAAVQAIATRVEMEAAAIDGHIRGNGEGAASVRLAAARGTAHASAMLLRGLREDHAAAIRRSGKAARWSHAIDALDRVAAMSPMVVGEGDLVRAGYQLLTAGAALRDILA